MKRRHYIVGFALLATIALVLMRNLAVYRIQADSDGVQRITLQPTGMGRVVVEWYPDKRLRRVVVIDARGFGRQDGFYPSGQQKYAYAYSSNQESEAWAWFESGNLKGHRQHLPDRRVMYTQYDESGNVATQEVCQEIDWAFPDAAGR